MVLGLCPQIWGLLKNSVAERGPYQRNIGPFWGDTSHSTFLLKAYSTFRVLEFTEVLDRVSMNCLFLATTIYGSFQKSGVPI